jgi:hypothetical protein
MIKKKSENIANTQSVFLVRVELGFGVLDSIKGLAQFSCKKAATGDFSVALKLLEALSE